ncbi:MAG: CDP-glycerol glycerophosphotransferase family protein [Deltaproteobacteria bacterium]|nr:CDP-glycerol glycerophosphotransferase family protein [Deltaproteobacteria bacterium]
MKRTMRAAYFMFSNFSHFGDLWPYYQHFGGLVHTTSKSLAQFLKEKYPSVAVTLDLAELRRFAPDVMLYASMQIVEGPWKHVQVFHGASDKPFYFEHRYEMERYDLCLCYGQREIDKFNKAGFRINAVPAGCARLDMPTAPLPPLFKNQRPVILYASSFGRHSSVERFMAAVYELSDKKFNVLVKPHPASAAEGGAAYDLIKRFADRQGESFKMVQSDNIVPLIKVCDLMLGDIGGSAYEAAYFDKPVLALNPDPAKYALNEEILSETYLWNFIDVVNEAEELAGFVQDTIEQDPRGTSRREIAAYSYYKHPELNALQVGIKAIESIL